MAQVYNILTCLMVLYTGCLVDGNVGDGTSQGNCPNGRICFADGTCKGTLIAALYVRNNVIVVIFWNFI